MTTNLKAVHYFEWAVSGSALHISVDHLVSWIARFHDADWALELIVTRVDWIWDFFISFLRLFSCTLVALVPYILCNLDIQQGCNQVVLLFDLLKCLDGEKLHLLIAKVMWDVWVEFRAQTIQRAWGWVLDSFLNTAQDVETFQNLFLRNLSKWHTLDIDIDRDHACLHHILVSEEFYKFLDTHIEFRFHIVALLNNDISLCVFPLVATGFLFLVVHDNCRVPLSLLCSSDLIKFVDSFFVVHSDEAFDPFCTDTSIPHIQTCRAIWTSPCLLLQSLGNVELVVVFFGVRPIHVCGKSLSIIYDHFVKLFIVAMRVHSSLLVRNLRAHLVFLLLLFLDNKDRFSLLVCLCLFWLIFGTCCRGCAFCCFWSSHLLF